MFLTLLVRGTCRCHCLFEICIAIFANVICSSIHLLYDTTTSWWYLEVEPYKAWNFIGLCFLFCFRQGLSDVIDLDWSRMFSYRELQTLISGADHEINVDDLQVNTKYGNGFSETHETIVNFWQVVRGFTEAQKRKLLKFVTSCSRPPLLGFKVGFICDIRILILWYTNVIYRIWFTAWYVS